jgi:hypothetical protein
VVDRGSWGSDDGVAKATPPGGEPILVSAREVVLADVIDEPIRYTDSPMDQEMNFPNPVVRTDLPTRRSRWPRVLLAALGVGLLVLLFLPQILGSKVGRRFVVSSIAGKTNMKVTIGTFKTSWFGGTSIQFLSMSDPAGRGMGAKSITTQASLWNLLRDRYRVGDCVIDGAHFEFVVDDGRGNDTFDFMKPQTPPAPGAPPQSTAARLLPNLSGRITINGGTVILHRGTVQPKLYNTVWQQGRLENVEAKFDIQSLDKPWTYSFAADAVEGENPRGTIVSSGTVDLGENRQIDVRQMKLDCTLSGENVRTGGLGAALIPESTPDDVRQAFGPVLHRIVLAMKASDGRLTFPHFEASGPIANFKLRPTVDLTVTPNVLEIPEGGGPGVIQVGVSKRVANQALVYLNPFFREAVGGEGNGGVTVHVDRLRAPLGGRQWAKQLQAKGRLWAQDVKLNRADEMAVTDPLPDNLASQLALLTGDEQKTVTLDVDGPFAIAQGVASHGPTATTVGDTTLTIGGATDLLSGAITSTASLVRSASISSRLQTSGPMNLAMPLTGTIRKPQLGVSQVKGDAPGPWVQALAARVGEQTVRMRAKETQRQMEKSQNQVQDILRPLQPPPGTPQP